MMSPTPVKILIEILSKSREQKARGKEGGRKKRVKEYKKDQLYSACARPTRAKIECFKNSREATSGISRLDRAKDLRLNS